MGTKTTTNQFDEGDDGVLPELPTVKEFDDEDEFPVPMEDKCVHGLEETNKLSLVATVKVPEESEDYLSKEKVSSGVVEDEKQLSFQKSFLIQSLIYHHCKLLEEDTARRKALFFGICRALSEKKLIDESYINEDLEEIRNKYLLSLSHLFTGSDGTELINISRRNEDDKSLAKNLPYTQKLCMWSRYQRDFDELNYIARGGFGFVYKAKNKLDGTEYAVKKIALRFHNVEDFRKSLLEVKLLARLHHPNIVAYKAAWLEPFQNDLTSNFEQSISTDSFSSSVYSSSERTSTSYLMSNRELSNELDKHESQRSFISSDMTSTEEKAVCLFTPAEETQLEHLQTTEGDCATLYIQMKLYDQTLQQWLNYRNEKKIPVNVQQCLIGFQSLVSGIEYIHSMGVIHHDIKPSNIFVNGDLSQVQVGDFGLACLLQHSQQDLTVLSQTFAHGAHTGMEIGTRRYAAPEQLKGVCNMKSDIYSLGIILFELLQPFTTEMEKSICIEQLKNGEVSKELYILAPELVKMMMHLISPTMNNRPTAKQLLNDLKFLSCNVNDISSACETIGLLLTQINQRDKEIEKLKNEKFQSVEEIKHLKQKLQRYEASIASAL